MLRKARPKCLSCDNETTKVRYKYCSVRCQKRREYLNYIEGWKAGFESGIQAPYGVSNYVRRYLIETHGEKCQRCGWAERHPTLGRVPLQLDHVDGDWQNCRESNLRLLCPNCHALTETFGNLNKGRGRAARYRKVPS